MPATVAPDLRARQPSPPKAIWLVYGLVVAAVLAALAQASVLLAGAVYIVLFLAVAWARTDVALMLIFASAPFQSDLSGGVGVRFSLAEVNLALTFAIMVVKKVALGGGRGVSLGPITIPVVLYLAVSCLASAVHWRDTAPVTLIQTALYLVVAASIFASLPTHIRQVDLALNGLICVGVGLALVAIALRSSYVLGLHKNGIGASLSCAFLVAAELWFAEPDRKRRRRYGIALAIIGGGLLLSLSRGAWLATASGLVLIVLMRRQFRLLLRAGLLVTPVIAALWLALPEQSRETATDLGNRQHGSLYARLAMIEHAWGYFKSSPLLGVGVGLRKEYDATNVVLATLAETGVVGLAAFGLIHVVLFTMVWRTQKRLPRSSRVYSLLMIGAALVLAKFTHGLLDHYWGRGSATLAWSGAGMAVWAYLAVRRERRSTLRAKHGEVTRVPPEPEPLRVGGIASTGAVP